MLKYLLNVKVITHQEKRQHHDGMIELYKVVKIDRDITLNTYYVWEGSNRHYNRDELLLID